MGPSVEYHESGVVRREETYVNDLQEGESVGYHENGEIVPLMVKGTLSVEAVGDSLVATLKTAEANREFQANVQLLQAQRQAAVEINSAMEKEKDAKPAEKDAKPAEKDATPADTTTPPPADTTTPPPATTSADTTRASAIPFFRVGENVPEVVSPAGDPSVRCTAMCARGTPRPSSSRPRSCGCCRAASSCGWARRAPRRWTCG